MNRADGIARLGAERFDILVVGGGATGLGTAVDAAARGYRTALIDAADFAAATSSRSTKLVHGGVRYLRNGDVRLVRHALRERANLRANAPHLVHELSFVIPAYRWSELAFYAAGLKIYDGLAGGSGFAPSRIVGPRTARAMIPALRDRGLRGAIVYTDGQFDDARLALTLARTAVDRGAALANYVRASEFLSCGGHITGVEAVDLETGGTVTIRARAVVNATGIFADELRRLEDPGAAPILAHSRGSHVVVRRDALGGAAAALLVPHTADGRVLFATPWHDAVIAGTTDVAVAGIELDPHPSPQEIAYILATLNRYLREPLGESDVTATFAGLRALLRRPGRRTSALSREHTIEVSSRGLITIAGGKWTTYRQMAQQTVDVAAARAGLPRAASPTERMMLHGATATACEDDTLRVYGEDARHIVALAAGDGALRARLHRRLPYTGAQVLYAVRSEMARTLEDVLSRRTRATVLDAAAAAEAADAVAAIMAGELGRDAAWRTQQLDRFRGATTEREPPRRPT